MDGSDVAGRACIEHWFILFRRERNRVCMWAEGPIDHEGIGTWLNDALARADGLLMCRDRPNIDERAKQLAMGTPLMDQGGIERFYMR